MKILHLNEHLGWSGGIETYLLSLIPIMRQMGHDSSVAYARGDSSLAAESHHVPTLEKASRRAIRDGYAHVAELINVTKPDLVHVHNVHNVGAIDAALHRVPVIVTAHDYRYVCPTSALFHRRSGTICEKTCGVGCFAASIQHKCMTPRPLYAARYYHRVRWMMANASRISRTIAPSAYVAERLGRSGFPAERTTVLPYFCPIEPAKEVTPRGDARPTLLFVGRVRQVKGVDVFVKALGMMPAKVRGVIVGDANETQKSQLRALATAAGCADRLEIRPWASREQMRHVYAEANVFTFPSLWAETLGIVGLEALAGGVPVVGSDVGGVREWLHDGKTGFLVQPNDPKALADAASRLIDAPQLRDAMGRNGIALVRSKFNPAAHVVNLIDLYEDAARSGPVPRVAA